ncbi:hypothetical protein D3C84_675080 [compost metagenome]
MHTLLGQALDFSGGGLHVPPGHQHQRDETTRRGIAPVMQVPVVVGLDRRQGYRTVGMHLETLASKAGESRKAQRTEHAIGVHVIDTVADVPGATAHLVVAQRLHAVLLLGPADHRIEAHVAGSLLLENPYITLSALDDMRLASLEAGRHVASKGIWRLDCVIIDADENQIFNLHCCFPLRLMGS